MLNGLFMHVHNNNAATIAKFATCGHGSRMTKLCNTGVRVTIIIMKKIMVNVPHLDKIVLAIDKI